MIGHESIIAKGTEVRCRCGHLLVEMHQRETEWTSEAIPGSVQWFAEHAHDAHIAELADRKLYGFDGDEYLQTDPADVFERWNDDRWDDPDAVGPLPPLEIIEWSCVDLNTQITDADRILERIAEDIGDECGYGEAGEAADEATRHPDVVEACEALRSAIAVHFTGWLMADKPLRTLIVTWDANGEPLLDGEPMYRKVAP